MPTSPHMGTQRVQSMTANANDSVLKESASDLLADKLLRYNKGRLPDGSMEINDIVRQLEAINPTEAPGLSKNYEKFASGDWKVQYAPHIRILEKILFQVFFSTV